MWRSSLSWPWAEGPFHSVSGLIGAAVVYLAATLVTAGLIHLNQLRMLHSHHAAVGSFHKVHSLAIGENGIASYTEAGSRFVAWELVSGVWNTEHTTFVVVEHSSFFWIPKEETRQHEKVVAFIENSAALATARHHNPP